ncbi:MAG: hypothetical protein SFX19_02485 [Alphaproteobacteria bacterium]|nr:hypothetical protein [Alphaproteobacteria bacterium]
MIASTQDAYARPVHGMAANSGVFMDSRNTQGNDNAEKQKQGWFAAFERWLERLEEKRIGEYIEKYARQEDGSLDEKLARRIRWEVGRRAETGKQLDIYEPLHWTGVRAVLGVLGAAGAKFAEARWNNQHDKKYFHFIEVGLIAGTAISSAIDLLRLVPRWLYGLEGGKNTALKLHRHFQSPPNDQLVYEPPPKLAEIEPRPDAAKNIKPMSLLERAQQDKDSSFLSR